MNMKMSADKRKHMFAAYERSKRSRNNLTSQKELSNTIMKENLLHCCDVMDTNLLQVLCQSKDNLYYGDPVCFGTNPLKEMCKKYVSLEKIADAGFKSEAVEDNGDIIDKDNCPNFKGSPERNLVRPFRPTSPIFRGCLNVSGPSRIGEVSHDNSSTVELDENDDVMPELEDVDVVDNNNSVLFKSMSPGGIKSVTDVVIVPSPLKRMEELTQLEHFDWDDDGDSQFSTVAESAEMYNIQPQSSRSKSCPWPLMEEL
jgi:hypothetical protein